MKRIINLLLLVLGLFLVPSVQAAPKHALGKVAQVVTAPVVHPKRTFKEVLGSVVFAAESVNDVALAGLTALDKAASMELKYNPFHYAAVVDGKIDAGIEKAEVYLFGTSN